MKKRICHFCKSGIEFSTIQIKKRFYPICYLCNKDGKHLKNNWEIKFPNGWLYKFFEDKFVKKDGTEISRTMLWHLLLNKKS